MSAATLNAPGAPAHALTSPGKDSRPLPGAAVFGLAPDAPGREAMVWIPGGDFTMGSNKFYREERPARRGSVGGFWIDPRPVTNADFHAFVQASGYLTTAERVPDPADYPDADPSLLVPG
jgi:sulfatase modifying factor 1